MRILPATFLFLSINIIRGHTIQGDQLGESQNREKRQNNIYQFLSHLLSSSSGNNGFFQNNYKQNFPQEFTSFPPPFYRNSGSGPVVVNVNQADSNPTTIINNLPDLVSSCPCEKYVRSQYVELQCLCPIKQIYIKCTKNTVCVLKSFCDHGLLFDTQVLQQLGSNLNSDLCNESTHVCCLPPTEIRKQNNFEEEHQIYNHFTNTTVDHLNNTVNKYIVSGNIYLNNGNPTTTIKAKKEEEFKFVNENKQEGNTPSQIQPNQFQPSSQGIGIPIQLQSSNHGTLNFPNQFQPSNQGGLSTSNQFQTGNQDVENTPNQFQSTSQGVESKPNQFQTGNQGVDNVPGFQGVFNKPNQFQSTSQGLLGTSNRFQPASQENVQTENQAIINTSNQLQPASQIENMSNQFQSGNQGNPPNQFQAGNQRVPNLLNQFQPNNQEIGTSNQFQPSNQGIESTLNQIQPIKEVSLSAENQNTELNIPTEVFVPQITTEENNPVQLNSVLTTKETLSSLHTIPPDLIRPTKPPIDLFTSQMLFESKIKEQNTDTTNTQNLKEIYITTFRPNLQTSAINNDNNTSTTTTSLSTEEATTKSVSDLLSPNEISNIFGNSGLNQPDATTFPGLATSSEKEAIPLTNPNEDPIVGVSIIENAPTGLLSKMDFPQATLQAPIKKQETFLTGKIEKLRNNTRMNATTANRIAQGVGQRIFVEHANTFHPNAPAFNQVQGQMFNFQEPMMASFMTPIFNPSSFVTPVGSNPILKACPSAMKCVQTMYCTPEGYISTVPVILSRDEAIKKNLLLDCGDAAAGQIGKCCFDRNV